MIHYIFLMSVEFTQEFNVSSYPPHWARCCLIPFLLRVRTVIPFNICVGWNSDLHNRVIIKLAFDTTILQDCQFVNRLTTRNISIEKVCSYHLANFSFFVNLTRSPNQIVHALNKFQPRDNSFFAGKSNCFWEGYLAWRHIYFVMDRIVATR